MLVALGSFLIISGFLVTTGCQSENKQYIKETPEALKAPTPESRSGPEEDFLPPRPEDQ